MRALASLGHPYSAKDIEGAPEALAGRTELDALIAYLQSLGRSRKEQPQS
jgi:cytochrome c oxidase cbb3-type subunit 2